MHVFLKPVGGGENIELDRSVTVIGRSPTCDVRLNSKKISRVHCCIVTDPQQTLVRDLDSCNGVEVNGESVREQQLMVGDELTIGDIAFRFMSQSEDEAGGEEPKPVAQEMAVTTPPNAEESPEAEDDGPQLAPLSSDFEIPPLDDNF